MKTTRWLIILGVLLLSLGIVSGALAAATATQSTISNADQYADLRHMALAKSVRHPARSLSKETLAETESPNLDELWTKLINDQLWIPDLQVTVETSDTIQVVDIITTAPTNPYNLIERWDPNHLLLLGYQVVPPFYNIISDQPGELILQLAENNTITVTKWFHVEPCVWTESTLWEELWLFDTELALKPVLIQKLPPILWIDSNYSPGVSAGFPAAFTLEYGNMGGYENNVTIYNYFPSEAPFNSANPPPDDWAADYSWVMWAVGDLASAVTDTIEVVVDIDPGLQPSATVEISDTIYNHIGESMDTTIISFHVEEPPGEPIFDLGDAPDSTNHAGVPMTAFPPGGPPGVMANYPTVFDPATGLPQGPRHSAPDADAWLGPQVTHEFEADLMPDVDGWTNIDPPPDWPNRDEADDGLVPGTLNLHHCQQSDFLVELNVVGGPASRYLNVWFDWNRDGDWNDVLECPDATLVPEWAIQNQVLNYGNGTHIFPTPSFLAFNPETPTWMRMTLARELAPIIPGTSIADGRGPANGYSSGETEDYFLFTEEPPPLDWGKWIDGIPWIPDITVTVETSDTIEVVDVITSLPFDPLVLVEEWNPAELTLVDWITEPPVGNIILGDGSLVWEIPEGGQVVTITKVFHVEPSDWTETMLMERLVEVGSQTPIVRPVPILKLPPILWIDSTYSPEVYAGDTATFTLQYGNEGGYENATMVGNEFPPEALFVSSDPPADFVAIDRSWAEWATGDLGMGDMGSIDVTVAISSGLNVSTTLDVVDWIYNHLENPADVVTTTFHITTPRDQEGDLYIKDNNLDDGSVASFSPWWVSPDIWVRHSDDGGTAHQNPLPGMTNYIYMRVRNRGTTTIHDINVDVYWGSAGLGLTWPSSWTPANNTTIPSLAPGAVVIVSVPWNTPLITGHFCLRARIDSLEDPIGSGPDTILPTDAVRNNNNIAQKNAHIVDYPEINECGFYTTTIYTDEVYFDAINTRGVTSTVNIEIDDKGFPPDGQIIIDPGDLWGRWNILTNFNQVGMTLIPSALPAMMGGIDMGPYETVRITMTISARIDEDFEISVEEQVNDKLVGGLTYVRDLLGCLYMPVTMRGFSPTLLTKTRITPSVSKRELLDLLMP
jgi:hypothetical protein